MKKYRTYSPFNDFKLASSPYETSLQIKRSHGKQVFTAQEKKNPSYSIKFNEKCKSYENLSKELRKDVKAAGDFNDVSKKIFEDFSTCKHLSSKACQTICQSKMPAQVVKRVSTHDWCHYLVRRRSSGNQRMLRYLLKLSNNTFYATLQHEIDVLKKEKKALEDESTLHAHAILNILKNQSDDKQVIMTLIVQNQKLEQVIKRKESLLDALSEDIRELKFRSIQPIFLTYVNHETVLKEDTEKPMDCYTKENKTFQKTSKSHPTIPTHKITPASQKPQSLSAPIITRLEEIPQSSTTSIDSELKCQLPTSNSDILTDTEILNKHVTFQKTAATNYSINDCPSSLTSSSSSKRIKSRTWTKLFCCR